MTTNSSKRHVERLFKQLIASYGAKFTGQYQSAEILNIARDEWFDRLKDFWPDQLQQAYKTSVDRYIEFPPTLGQFADLCKAPAPGPSQRHCEAHGCEEHVGLSAHAGKMLCETHNPQIQQGIREFRELCKSKKIPANF